MATLIFEGPYLFQSEKTQSSRQRETRESHDEKPARRYCCAVCKAYVTDDRYRTMINQQHCHTRTNPNNQTFSFGCFAKARGCQADGIATDEHSWFMGYRWRYAHCKNCGVQLGWQFVGEHDFYALVLEQLVDCSD